MKREEDGCELDSELERIFHRALLHHGLKHEAHTSLPGEGGKADFRIDDVYVEVWGLKQEAYKERRKEKTRYYQERHLKLVEVEPEDLDSATKVHEKILEVVTRIGARQKRLPSQRRYQGESVKLDLYPIAEAIALEREGSALKQIDDQIDHCEKGIEEARAAAKAAIENLMAKIQQLQANRKTIIDRYMYGS